MGSPSALLEITSAPSIDFAAPPEAPKITVEMYIETVSTLILVMIFSVMARSKLKKILLRIEGNIFEVDDLSTNSDSFWYN